MRVARVGPRGTLLSLAVELLERVVAQLDARSQYALLFVCRDLSAVAQAALLSDIAVSNPREAYEVLRLVEEWPAHGERIRAFRSAVEAEFPITLGIIAAAPNLERLAVTFYGWRDEHESGFAALRGLLAHRPLLHDLELADGTPERSLDAVIAGLMPDSALALQLRTLVIIGFAGPVRAREIPPLPQLTRLVNCDSPYPEIAAMIAKAPALRAVCAFADTVALAALSEAQCGGLVALELWGMETADGWRVRLGVEAQLRRLRSLQSLRIDDLGEVEDLLAALPGSVVEIAVTSRGRRERETADDLADALAGSTVPALRKLSLPGGLSTPRLNAVCARRGIRIESVPMETCGDEVRECSSGLC